MTNKALLAAFLTLTSSVLSAQKREDFIALQRDVAQMQDQMKELQKSQDEKLGALTALVQQTLDASARMSTGLMQLQKNVETTLADQQTKVVGPVVGLGTKVDQMADDYKAMKENINALSAQLSKLDTKLADISGAVRVLSNPVAPPTAAGGPPANVPSAQTLWENANRDVSGGNDTVAMQEYVEYLKYYHDTENAPTAQYNIGTIYDRADQHQDALKAFNAVLEFPENPRSPDALYWKGMEQMKMDQNTEAAATFREFLKRYPGNENARKARANLATLSGPARPTTTHKQK
jgi:TolA-binding protein